jgi:heat shock protein HslJ
MILFQRLIALFLSALSLSACNAPRLSNTDWALQSIDGHTVVSHSEATLSFLPEGRMAGSASCNRYFGQFKHTELQLQLSVGGVTKMFCHSDHGDVMAQETRFLQALSAAQGVGWEGEQLLIHLTDSAEPLRFVAVKP